MGSPARAGMAPRSRGLAGQHAGLPRPRGDGPHRLVIRDTRRLAPPPARGWPRDKALDASGERGSPARAGMAPSASRISTCGIRLPRPRGDGPVELTADGFMLEAPPPARGWPQGLRVLLGNANGSPARAGMAPRARNGGDGQTRLPRPRGDGPPTCNQTPTPCLAPPPARGWPLGG